MTGLPVSVMECDNAPLLGSAILAAVGAGWFDLADDEIGDKRSDGKREKKGENGEKNSVEMMRRREKEEVIIE